MTKIRLPSGKLPFIRSLPLTNWPEADRFAWAAACRRGKVAKGGAASHLAPITKADLVRRYGYFLDFVERCSALDRDAPPAALVTHDHIAAFIAELQQRVSSVTVSGTIYKVRRAAECLAPNRDFGWLKEIGRDLALLERPKDKFNRVVLSERLVEAGLALMEEADAQRPSLHRAVLARNGLMLALLALCPIRLKNFTALEIGRSFVKVDGGWWIVLVNTKSKRPDHRPVPAFLAGFVQQYLEVYRPLLARRGTGNRQSRSVNFPETAALWLGWLGASLSYGSVASAIVNTTRMTLGIPISPHLFRTSGATSAALYAPQSPDLASALLQHSDPRITEAHYSRASSLSVARDFTTLVRQLGAL